MRGFAIFSCINCNWEACNFVLLKLQLCESFGIFQFYPCINCMRVCNLVHKKSRLSHNISIEIVKLGMHCRTTINLWVNFILFLLWISQQFMRFLSILVFYFIIIFASLLSHPPFLSNLYFIYIFIYLSSLSFLLHFDYFFYAFSNTNSP